MISHKIKPVSRAHMDLYSVTDHSEWAIVKLAYIRLVVYS